jgi:hypothetical protein
MGGGSIEQLRAHALDARDGRDCAGCRLLTRRRFGAPGFRLVLWAATRSTRFMRSTATGISRSRRRSSSFSFIASAPTARSCTSTRRPLRRLTGRPFPYMYAAADSTPLFLLAVEDYVRASGDVAFLTAHRDAIEKAWAFETDPRTTPTTTASTTTRRAPAGWRAGPAACRTRRFIWRCSISRLRPMADIEHLLATPENPRLPPAAPTHRQNHRAGVLRSKNRATPSADQRRRFHSIAPDRLSRSGVVGPCGTTAILAQIRIGIST